MTSRSRRQQGFSLAELLIVLGLVSLLAALLFPVFLTARGKARQVVCASNLRQIGMGMMMYMQDCNGRYPHAVDPAARESQMLWQPYLPKFAADIPRIAMLQEVLQPYLKSPQLFSCPADIGFAVTDLTNVPLDAFPSSFEKYGTSYYYRTTLAGCRKTDASLEFPSQNWVLVDGVGYWHGTLLPLEPRYNVLLADGHVKNLTWAQWRATGGRQLNENALPFGGCH